MTATAATPSAERLGAAVRLVVERLAPDQIILFGSAARGEMTRSSDLDFLVINDDDGGRFFTRHERWNCSEAGGQVDVVLTNRATAQRHRLSASHVQGAALEEGRTVYLRDGVTPIPTGPTYHWNGTEMVKTTRYEPDHAVELLERAERRWATANREGHPVNRCEDLHRVMELTLKALIIADGRRVEHVHGLDQLWRQAEASGEHINAPRDSHALAQLDQRVACWRYDTPTDADPVATWEENRTTGEAVLNHARRRVPQLIDETRRALASRTEGLGALNRRWRGAAGSGNAARAGVGTAARRSQETRADERDRTHR